jgi:hypothetical protein
MKNIAAALAFAAAFIAPASAITIKFHNNCGYSERYSVVGKFAFIEETSPFSCMARRREGTQWTA